MYLPNDDVLDWVGWEEPDAVEMAAAHARVTFITSCINTKHLFFAHCVMTYKSAYE